MSLARHLLALRFAAIALAPLATVAAATTDLATLPFPGLSIKQGWGDARAGRSVDGNPLRVAGKTYASGIGTHAKSEWSLPLNGESTELSGACGVDDETEAKASVQFVIEGDKKILWKSPVMKKGDAPAAFSVKLTGVKNLRLLANDAGDGNTGDHADWLDLRLEHSGKPIAAPVNVVSIETDSLAWVFTENNGRLEQRRFGTKTAPDRTVALAVKAYPDYLDTAFFAEPTIDILGADGLRNLYLKYDSQKSTVIRAGVTRTDVILKDAQTDITVELHFTAYAKHDIIEAGATIRNDSKEAVTLLRFDAFNLGLSGDALRVTNFRGGWGDEMMREESPVTPGLRRIGVLNQTHPTQGYSSSFLISSGKVSEDKGRVVAGSLEWNGNWHIDFTSLQAGSVSVSGGIHPMQPQRLGAGASFDTAPMLLSASDNGAGEISRRFHRWAHDGGIRQAEAVRPVILNSWDGAYFSFDEKRLLAMMDGSTKAGVEMFVLDDGWFGNGADARDGDNAGLGDWETNHKKLPHDIQWLAEQANARGLKFGLWVEPEMVNPQSELFRKHPDWAVKLPGREQRLMRNQIPLDMSKPEVEEFAYRCVADLLDKYPGIEYIKWDNNGFLRDPGSQGASPDAQQNMTTGMTRAYLRVMDRLVAKYPKIVFQLCASGGGRVEYGALSRHAEFWASDNQNPVKRLRMHWGYSHFFPAFATAAHIAESFNSKDFPMKFRADVAMTGRLGIELDPSHLKPDQVEELRRGVEEYKRLRPLLHTGDLYRGLSPFDSDIVTSSRVVADKSKTVFFAFRIENRNKPASGRLIVPGLDAAKRYRVTEAHAGATAHVAAASFSGKELLEQGLPVQWTSGYESAVVELTAE